MYYKFTTVGILLLLLCYCESVFGALDIIGQQYVFVLLTCVHYGEVDGDTYSLGEM